MTTLIDDLTPSDDSGMNSNESNEYNPTEDDNQGVVQLLSQGEAANAGVSQAEQMSPVTAQGPEPVKEEVSDRNDGPPDANGINDDLLAEEDVENGDIEIDNETDE